MLKKTAIKIIKVNDEVLLTVVYAFNMQSVS